MPRSTVHTRPVVTHTVVLALVASTLAMFATLFAAAPANAANSPTSSSPAARRLRRSTATTIPVDPHRSLPAGAPKGYNLAFRAVLPAGTSYAPGSAGTSDGEPPILANAPTSGKTTLIWHNVDDLVANSSHTLSFLVHYNNTSSTGTPKYDVGDVLSIDTRRLHLDRPPRRDRLQRARPAVGPAPTPTPARPSSRRTPR